MISGMPETVADLFLAFSHDRLQLLASRIVDCVGRLSNEQVWARGSGTRTRLAISCCISAGTCNSGLFQVLEESLMSAIEIPSSPHVAVMRANCNVDSKRHSK